MFTSVYTKIVGETAKLLMQLAVRLLVLSTVFDRQHIFCGSTSILMRMKPHELNVVAEMEEVMAISEDGEDIVTNLVARVDLGVQGSSSPCLLYNSQENYTCKDTLVAVADQGTRRQQSGLPIQQLTWGQDENQSGQLASRRKRERRHSAWDSCRRQRRWQPPFPWFQ